MKKTAQHRRPLWLISTQHMLLFVSMLLSSCSSFPSSPSPSPNPPHKGTATQAPVQIKPTQNVKFASPNATNTPTPRSSSTPTRTITPSVELTAEPLTTTILFTGIIVPARCVQAKLDAIGNPNYPYEEVRSVISAADLSVGVFNATMSDQVEHTGCLTTWQLVGSPDNADAAAWAGFDLMSVATNHIKDCGLMKSWCDNVFFDTLGHLHRVGIQTVGGGKDLSEALEPVVYNLNGVRFGFVSLGDSKMTPFVFAGEDHPGIAHLNSENIQTAVEQARQAADVVIALPHWGSEDNAVPNWNQTQQARELISAGADLIVGNHTHVVQAIQEIDGVPVFYGLGNFVFDQGLRDHRQGIILLVKYKGLQYAGYELIPTHTDADGRVHIADKDEAAEILQSIERSSRLVR